jgi:hypothetical protein
MEIALSIAILALLVAGYFLWGRGLIKSKKSDLILGFSVLALWCFIAFGVADSSAVFSEVGMLVVIFGIETLVASYFAKPDCPLGKRERVALGTVALIIGFCGTMIV